MLFLSQNFSRCSAQQHNTYCSYFLQCKTRERERVRAESTLAILPFSVGRLFRRFFLRWTFLLPIFSLSILFIPFWKLKKIILKNFAVDFHFSCLHVCARGRYFFFAHRWVQAYFDQVLSSFLFHRFLHGSHFVFLLFRFSLNRSSSNDSRNAIYCWKIARETYSVRLREWILRVVNVSWLNEPNILCLLIHLWTN